MKQPPQAIAKISKSPSLKDFCELIESARGDFSLFNDRCLSASFSKLGKLAKETRDLPPNLPVVYELLTSQVESMANQMDARGVANIVHGVASAGFFTAPRMGDTSARLYAALVREIVQHRAARMNEFKPQELANMCWSLAKIPFEPGRAVLALAGQHIAAQRPLHDFEAQHLSNILWAWAKLGESNAGALDKMAAELLARGIAGFKTQDTANCLWALGSLLYKNNALLSSMVAQIDRAQLQRFKPQELSNTAWSLARLQVADAALWDDLVAEMATRDLHTFKAQELSNFVWALAILHIPARTLLDLVASHVRHRGFAGFLPRHVSIITWSYASAGSDNTLLFKTVAAHCARQGMSGFDPQNLSNLAWAFATSHVNDASVPNLVARESVRRGLADYDPQHISNILWALASTEIDHPEFCVAVLHELARRDFHTFTTQNLSMLAWSSAVLGLENGALLTRIASECASRSLIELEAQAIVNLAWSFACSGMLHDEPVLAFFRRDENVPLARRVDHAQQYNDVMNAWLIEYGEPLPPLLQRVAEGDWISPLLVDRNKGGSSKTHLVITNLLESLGFDCDNETRSPFGHSIDIEVVSPDGKQLWWVEVDGPYHFMHASAKPTGRTRYKRSVLSRLIGEDHFKSVVVPGKNWWSRRLHVRREEMREMMAAGT